MIQTYNEKPLATVSASMPRRILALVVLLSLGSLLVYLGFVSLGGFIGRSVLVFAGCAVLFFAEKLRQQSDCTLSLTSDGVYNDSGELLVPMSQIERIERGTFAAKPSNGFTIVTKNKMSRAWVPGIWWRIGRRFGVGGISSAGASKFMAEQISLLLKS